MKIYEFTPDIPLNLYNNIFKFERLFTYPLNETQQFRIDHSPNYEAFFSSLGKSRIFFVEKESKIIAVVAVVIRDIRVGKSKKKVCYIGDLKIHPDFRFSQVLYKLYSYVNAQIDKDIEFFYSVVMDGTKPTPDKYSGRLGIPQFFKSQNLHILKFVAKPYMDSKCEVIDYDAGKYLYSQLNSNFDCSDIPYPNQKSLLNPVWFKISNKACAMIEDTRRAKRLFIDNGCEIIAAHISYFSFNNVESAQNIIKYSINYAYQKGYESIFIALTEDHMLGLDQYLDIFTFTKTKATIYTTSQELVNIAINSSEI